MSKAAQLAQKSKFYIAGSSGAAKTISAIAAGYPTIITISGHGLANGDSLTIAGVTGSDAALLNGITGAGSVLTCHTTGASNDTFALNIDTTGKTLTASGTVTPALWVQVKEVKKIGKSGAKTSTVDVTDLDSDAKEFRTGLVDNGAVPLELNEKTDDPGQLAFSAAFTSSNTITCKVALNGGSNRTFDGSVTGFDPVPDVAVDGVQTIAAEVKISGAVTRS